MTRARSPRVTSIHSIYVIADGLNSGGNERSVELNILLLNKTFLAAERNGGRGLNPDQFVDIMSLTIGGEMTETQLETLFTKVDVESLGYIKWATFLNYFVQEYQEKNRLITKVSAVKPFPNVAEEFELTRKNSIMSVCYIPVYHHGVIDYAQGRYVTITSDGIINIWDMTVKYVACHPIECNTSENYVPLVVYDMVFIPALNLVAACTANRDIIFHDISLSNTFTKSYHVTGLEHTAMCMDFCHVRTNTAVLIWGDMSGNVFGIEFDMRQSGLFGMAKVSKKDEYVKVQFADIMKGTYVGTVIYSMMYLHNDWVSQVKYIKEDDIFISCCQDPDTCIFLGDLKEKKTCYYFKMKEGAIALDYCPVNNIIAAGGMDYCIRVWNPYVRSDATIIFKGFTKPIAHVAINAKRGDIIGIDRGNTVRIFSLEQQVLLQVVAGGSISSSRLPISAIFFNPQLQLIVLATSRLSVLQKTQTAEERLTEKGTHGAPVRCMCYSEAYDEVVSACEESVINVWNIITGARVIQITKAHTRQTTGEPIPVELTAMALDRTGRRLITAGKDGNVKVWNYSNGATLHSLFVPGTTNITSILNVNKKIYISGWDKFIGVFVDGAGIEEYKAFKKVHTEEILCMLHVGANVIATAAYDGEIILWGLDRKTVICKLHYLVEVDKENEERKAKERERLRSLACPTGIVATEKGVIINNQLKPSILKNKYDKLPAISSRASKIEESFEQVPSDPALFPGTLFDRLSMQQPKLSTCFPKAKQHRRTGIQHGIQEKKTSVPQTKISSPEVVNNTTSTSYLYNGFNKMKGGKKFVHGYAIEAMLMLKSRPFDKNTANLITAGAGGWVRAWNIDKRGGHIIGQFNPTRTAGENTCALATDKQNKYLITGDSQGYLAVWDIRSFCISQQSKAKILDENFTYNFIDEKKFVYLRKYKACQKLLGTVDNKRNTQRDPFNIHSEFFLETPPLLTVYQGHTSGINSVLYVDKFEVIVTASSDASVRVWTLYGVFCGTLGHDTWKDIDEFHLRDPSFSRVPSDIRRVASATTLKVLNAGSSTHWDEALVTMRNMGLLNEEERVESEEDFFIEPTRKPSQILGKFYQSRVRHRMPPTLPKLIDLKNGVACWHAIKYSEIDDTIQFRPNNIMGVMSQTQRMRIKANEREGLALSYMDKLRRPKLKKMSTLSVAPRVENRNHLKEKIREQFQKTRADVERVNVDHRMAGSKPGLPGAAPIVVT